MEKLKLKDTLCVCVCVSVSVHFFLKNSSLHTSLFLLLLLLGSNLVTRVATSLLESGIRNEANIQAIMTTKMAKKTTMIGALALAIHRPVVSREQEKCRKGGSLFHSFSFSFLLLLLSLLL